MEKRQYEVTTCGAMLARLTSRGSFAAWKEKQVEIGTGEVESEAVETTAISILAGKL